VFLRPAAGSDPVAPRGLKPVTPTSRARNSAATATHAATATQSMNRLSGSMKARWATWPNVSVATLYMPSGKTTLHKAGS
jgi:hypothetical protein